MDRVVINDGRVVVPSVLRGHVLTTLHRAHQGNSGMCLRAQAAVWWPGYTVDIQRVRDAYLACRGNAPSQPMTPPVRPPVPDYPWQLVSTDFFSYGEHTYLVIVDRYSGWPCVCLCRTESAGELVTNLRSHFSTWGMPEELTSDGGTAYTASETRRFLEDRDVRHRVSTAYNPHSNLRAETAVKTVKRLVTQNTGARGSLDTDALALALLQYRNTPDRDTGRSPSQVLFARKLRDGVPCDPADL